MSHDLRLDYQASADAGVEGTHCGLCGGEVDEGVIDKDSDGERGLCRVCLQRAYNFMFRAVRTARCYQEIALAPGKDLLRLTYGAGLVSETE